MPFAPDSPYRPRALTVLRRNIETLLRARKEDQVALARWVGHSKSWINKFLQEDREVQLRDLDRIADFFGVETYQLFQPGINRLTERRAGVERRAGSDRRVGHSGRLLSTLQAELNKSPRLAAASGPGAAAASGGEATAHARAVPAPVQVILVDAERRIAAYYAALARGQAPDPRAPRANAVGRRRDAGGSPPPADSKRGK